MGPQIQREWIDKESGYTLCNRIGLCCGLVGSGEAESLSPVFGCLLGRGRFLLVAVEGEIGDWGVGCGLGDKLFVILRHLLAPIGLCW